MLVRLTLSALAVAAATSMALAETGGAMKGPQGGAMKMQRKPPAKAKAPADATSGRATPEGGKGKQTPPNAPNENK